MIQNKKILFLSFLIGFMLWFYIKLGNTTRQEIDIPVRIAGLPKNQMIVNDYPVFVRVQAEADGRSMIAIRFFADMYYEVEVSDYKNPTRLIFYPDKEHIRIPVKWSVKILDILSPDSILLTFEEKIRKKVAVRPEVTVKPASGYILVGGIRAEPDSVTITCPKSYKDSITHVPTEKLEVKNIQKEEMYTVNLRPSASRLITYPEKVITVYLNVQPLGEIAMNNIPVRLVNVPENRNLIVQPSTFSVRIRGGVRYLSTLSRDSVWGVIDYALEQKLNRSEPVLTLRLPSDVTATQITPFRFKIQDLDER